MRVLGRGYGPECVDWAGAMLVAGHDTPHLRQLAGLLLPVNAFEVAELRDRALEELGYAPLAVDDAMRQFAAEYLTEVLRGTPDLEAVLLFFKDLFVYVGLSGCLKDLYLLHHARERLQAEDVQFYWPGATRANIDDVIKQRMMKFIVDAGSPPVPQL